MKRLFEFAALFLTALIFSFTSCKTGFDDEPTYYTVTVASTITNGTVNTNKTNAEAGETVKLTATPADGYELSTFSVTDLNTNAITVTEGIFTMPAVNVTVSATFIKTEATINQEAADAVIAKISLIGTVTYTIESKAKIDAARSAYDAMNDAQKSMISSETLAVLTAAETNYDTLKAAADEETAKQEAFAANQTAVNAVITKISAIGTVTYTDASKALIDAARTAYNVLTAAQKALISTEMLAVLTTAESTYSMLKARADEAAANQTAADAVIEKINAIGMISYTTDCKSKIDDARTSYDAMTAEQKALVSADTLAVLITAESTYSMLKTGADESAANQATADAVIEKINAIGTVFYTTESKTKIDEARAAYDALTETQKSLIPSGKLSVLTEAESAYNMLKEAAIAAAVNQAAADDVIAKINVIGTVAYTDESKAKIDDARSSYDALTATQKTLVTNYNLLTTAESEYSTLKEASENQNTITVIITKSDFGNFSNLIFDGESMSFSKDGVTVTARNIDPEHGNLMNGGSFSTTLGNFTKIVVTAADCQAYGSGWSDRDLVETEMDFLSSQTWTGNSSNVTFDGNLMGCYYHITIVCTIKTIN